MPRILTTKQRIAKPPLIVWGQLADTRAMAKWMPGVRAIDTAYESGHLREGSIVLFRARGAERQSEVLNCEAPSLLTLRASQGDFTATYRYSLEPAENGTLATLQVDCSATGMVRLMLPLIMMAIWMADGRQLRRLRRAAESA